MNQWSVGPIRHAFHRFGHGNNYVIALLVTSAKDKAVDCRIILPTLLLGRQRREFVLFVTSTKDNAIGRRCRIILPTLLRVRHHGELTRVR